MGLNSSNAKVWRRFLLGTLRQRLIWPVAGVSLLFLLTLDLQSADRPVIAIVIDDMGYNMEVGDRALALPGAVTYAFLPHTPHVKTLADRAHRQGREIMLHMPMEPRNGASQYSSMLKSDMADREFRRSLLSSIASVPYVSGVNNHMGSHLTRDEVSMNRLMDMLSLFGLFFIDSRTTDYSVAEDVAREQGVPSASRSIFLDHIESETFVRGQLNKLVSIAKRRGGAIGIGHPRDVTLAVLAEELPKLEAEGIRIVPVSRLTTQPKGRNSWQASSSPLPKVAKNSKR